MYTCLLSNTCTHACTRPHSMHHWLYKRGHGLIGVMLPTYQLTLPTWLPISVTCCMADKGACKADSTVSKESLRERQEEISIIVWKKKEWLLIVIIGGKGGGEEGESAVIHFQYPPPPPLPPKRGGGGGGKRGGESV